MKIGYNGCTSQMAINFVQHAPKNAVLVPLGRAQGYELHRPLDKDYPDDLDYFVHFAAATPPQKDESEYDKINYNGTSDLHTSLGFRNKKLKRFIYISTGGVYGYLPEPNVEMEDYMEFAHTSWYGLRPKYKAADAYALSKQKGESAVWSIESSPFAVTVIRPFFPYTWNDGPKRLIGRLKHNIEQEIPIRLNKDAEPKINPIHMDDLSKIIWKTLTRKDKQFEIYNAAGPTTMNIKELAERIGKRLNKKPVFVQTDNDVGGNMLGDTTKITEKLGIKLKQF